MRFVKIAFETQMLHNTALSPHKLKSIYADYDWKIPRQRSSPDARKIGQLEKSRPANSHHPQSIT
jgi:hypothetical protein